MSQLECVTECFVCCQVRKKAAAAAAARDRKSQETASPVDQIPPQYGSLLRAWVKLQTEAGADRFELAGGIEEIVKEFRDSGEVAGAEYLRFWTKLLREQMTACSGC